MRTDGRPERRFPRILDLFKSWTLKKLLGKCWVLHSDPAYETIDGCCEDCNELSLPQKAGDLLDCLNAGFSRGTLLGGRRLGVVND